MSRRKQANPKPLKLTGEGAGQDADYGVLGGGEPESDQDHDFPEIKPLVIDSPELCDTSSSGNSNQGGYPPQSLRLRPFSVQKSTSDSQSQADSPLYSAKTPPRSVANLTLLPSSMQPCPSDSMPVFPSDGNSQSLSLYPTDQYDANCYSGSNSNRASPASSVGSGSLQVFSKFRNSAPSKTRRKGDKILPISNSEGQEQFKCPKCDIVLHSLTDLTKHIRSHNTSGPAANSNMCTICGKILSSQSSLDRHMLVHSGERPFKCRVCKMSFTTNGNMHRHMRIHEKDGTMHAASALLDDTPPGRPRGGTKRKPTLDHPLESHIPGSPVRSRPAGMYLPDFGPPTPKKPTIQECKPQMPITIMPQIIGVPRPELLNGEEVAIIPAQVHRPIPRQPPKEPPVVKQEKQEDSVSDNPDQEQLHCPVCSKPFLSKCGLETHMETHPNISVRCHLCLRTYQSPRDLQMHHLMEHSADHDPSAAVDPSTKMVPNVSLPIGFHELSFIDFTTSKFTLVAKAWCEENPRRTSSTFHNYACTPCRKAFPSWESLHLHQRTHTHETTALCTICNTSFIDNDTLQSHILQTHLKDQVIETVIETASEEMAVQEKISQTDFMTVIGLKETESPSNEKIQGMQTDSASKPNKEYYKKLEEFAHRLSSHKQFSSTIGSELGPDDFADIQDILKVTATPRGFPSLRTPSDGSSRHRHADSGFYDGLSHISPSSSLLKSLPQPHKVDRSSSPDMMSQPNGISQSAVPGDSYTQKGDVFTCNYCKEPYTNLRALKGHIRAHLGLAPYKCNLCEYSSTDKSTLIRHLRTHNGERPFQCLICEFAFTTKANCERHVRNRHGKTIKDDIDQSIGYNQYMMETQGHTDCFGSPDTVCKYCGVDFKFFRALKHHLRSHSSCRNKPFMCKLCDNGFSTKANCVRHIQKQHPEVEQIQIENMIQMNETMYQKTDGTPDPLKRCSDLDLRSPKSDIPGELSITPANPGLIKPKAERPLQREFTLARPPFGLRTPPPNLMAPNIMSGYPQLLTVGSRPVHPAFPAFAPHLSSVYITSPPKLPIKQESSVVSSDDQPLDFSMKTLKGKPNEPQLRKVIPGNIKQEVKDNKSPSLPEEQPMDLSVSKPGKTDRSAPVKDNIGRIEDDDVRSNVSSPAGHTVVAVQSPATTPLTVTHLSTSNPRSSTNPELGMLRYKRDYQKYYNPEVGRLQCPYCRMLFKHGLKLQVHIRSHTNERPFQCRLCSHGFTIKTNLERHMKARHPEMTGFDTADPPNQRTSPAPSNMIDNTQGSSAVIPHEPNNNLPKDSKISLSSGSDPELSSVNKILDATSPSLFKAYFEQNVTSPALSTATDESELSEKSSSFVSQKNQINQRETDDDRSTVSPSQTSQAGEKRKRNSYADSPHKLMCPYCPRAFPWVSSLKRHILTHTGQKPFKCPKCPVTFSTKSNRERHLIRKHGVNSLDPATRQMMDRPFKCHLCIYSSFSVAGNLLRHYREKHPGAELPEHVSAAGKNNNGTNHQDDMDGHRSPLSDLQDSDNNNMDEEEDYVSDDEELEASLKHEASSTPRSITPASLPESTPERHINPERDNYNVDKITDCWKCGEKFPFRKILLRHLKDHNIDLPYKCYLCDASYEKRHDCLEHKVSQHPSDWSLLKEKNKVTDIGEYVQCMEQLVEQYSDGVTSLEEGKADVEDLKVESDYNQRKVYCSLCPKRFWSLQDLRRHMRSHTGERPFECDICQKRFTLKHSMMRHRRKHTGAGDINLSDEEDETSVSLSSEIRDSPRKTPGTTNKRSAMHDSGLGADQSSDMLQNLLGIEDSAIDQMLTSVDTAVTMLGV